MRDTSRADAEWATGHQNVPDAFIVTAVTALQQTPSLQVVNGLDAVASRSDLQFNDAFKQVVDRMTAVRDALEYTVRTKKANLAAAALQTYYLAKGLAEQDQCRCHLACDQHEARPRQARTGP